MEQRIAETRTADGTHVAYAVSGHGRPLVYASGWLSHLRQGWDLPSERAFYESLAAGRRLVRYDPPGCGLSDRGSSVRHSMSGEVDALGSVIDATGVDRVDLLGSSLGAAVAVTWAARHPERVDRLVLYGGWALGSAVATPEIQGHVMGLIREHWGLGSELLADLFAPDATPDMRRAFAQYQRESSSAATACAMLRLAYDLDVRELLPLVGAPTLVVHRERDRAAPLAQGRALAESIDGARLHVVPGRSHLPYVGDFTPLVEAVREFLGLPPRSRPVPVTLTARQLEVAALVAEGLTNKEIGERLAIAERSAEAHIERIRLKLDLRSRAQLAAWYATSQHPN